MTANSASAKICACQGQRATEATTPTNTAAKPSHSAKRPGRTASITNKTSAKPNQVQDTSEPSCIVRLHPALEFAHRKLPDHQHASLAVIEARDGGKILSAGALESACVLDRDLF